MALDKKTHALLVRQLSKFRNAENVFSRDACKENVASMPAWKWWQSYGHTIPKLRKLGIQVLSQCSVASACERNWSSYDFIISKKRNRLTLARANDLVDVFANLRLSKKLGGLAYEEGMVQWAEDREAACSEENEVRSSSNSVDTFESEVE